MEPIYNSTTFNEYLSLFYIFISSNLNDLENKEIIQKQLKFFIDLGRVKKIPACFLLSSQEILNKLIALYFEYPILVKELLEIIYDVFNFEMLIPNDILERIKEIIENGIEIKTYPIRYEKNNIERLFEEIIYLYNAWAFLEYDITEDLNIYLERYEEIKSYYQQLNNEIEQFTKDFFNLIFFKKLDEIINNKKPNIQNNLNLLDKNKKENVENIPLKNRTFFYINEEIIKGEDLYIEFKNYLFPLKNNKIEELKKIICGFLNAKGGRIYIGITNSKIIKGVYMDYKKRDTIRNDIINYTYDFFPKCRTNKLKILFIPIKDNNGNYKENLYIIKIIVYQGDTNQLYSITEKGFISYIRLQGQCICLSALEIREEIIKRESNPEIKINDNEFNDPEPEIPNFQKNNKKNNNFESLYNNLKSNIKIIDSNNYVENEENYEYEEYEEKEDEEENNNRSNKRSNFKFKNKNFNKQNYNYNKGIKNNNRGIKGKKKNDYNYIKQKYFVVKVTCFGISPSIKKLNFIFKNVNCKKKFLIKDGTIHGFLNFNDFESAENTIKQFNNLVVDGCGVRLNLQNIP